MGTMQTNNKTKTRQHLLYLWYRKFGGVELAHGTPMGKGVTRSVSKIRLASSKTSMPQVQHSSWRSRSSILRQDVRGKRKEIHGQTETRQARISKSIRPLHKTN